MLFPRLLAVPALLVAGAGILAQEVTDAPVAARGRGGITVTVEQLDRVMLERYGAAPQGIELLDLLIQARLVERLADTFEVEVNEGAVSSRWEDLDRQARAAGEARGLLPEIEKRGFTPEEFRDFLRITLLLERLTRKALGLSAEDRVTSAQQEIWLSQEMAERGMNRPAPPWADGVVARCGDLEIGTEEFAGFLRRRLPRATVREACWHLLLLAGIESRMPDLSPEARKRGVDTEIARRRASHEREHPEITFEQRLGAAGRTLRLLRQDPSVQIAVLSRLWVDRTAGTDGLRETYEDERSLFDGRFGKSVRTHLLFLVAARFTNDLNPRTYEMAEEELAELRSRIGNTDDFEALARQFSEDPGTRLKRGELGWVTRADPRYPKPMCEAIFQYLETGGDISAEGSAIGPVRLDTGCALLWISGVTPSPSWEVMSEHVHEELRRRFVEEVMPQQEVEVLIFEGTEAKQEGR